MIKEKDILIALIEEEANGTIQLYSEYLLKKGVVKTITEYLEYCKKAEEVNAQPPTICKDGRRYRKLMQTFATFADYVSIKSYHEQLQAERNIEVLPKEELFNLFRNNEIEKNDGWFNLSNEISVDMDYISDFMDFCGVDYDEIIFSTSASKQSDIIKRIKHTEYDEEGDNADNFEVNECFNAEIIAPYYLFKEGNETIMWVEGNDEDLLIYFTSENEDTNGE